MMDDWEQYQVTMPAMENGDWKIDIITLDEEKLGIWGGVSMEEYLMGRQVLPGTYRRLKFQDEVWMTDTPAEIEDHEGAFKALKRHRAKSALITGLGLGMVVQAALRTPTMRRVSVVEIDQDVIDLVGDHYMEMANEHGVVLTIINADALEYEPPGGVRFDVVWHDIWPKIGPDNLPTMRTLHRRYEKRAKWVGSWAQEECRFMKFVEADMERRGMV
jgi:hypothetical protein